MNERQLREYAENAFEHGVREAAKLIDQEAASAEALTHEAAERGDSHAKMRLWAIRDNLQILADTVRHFADDAEWCRSSMDELDALSKNTIAPLTYCGRCDEKTPTDAEGKCPACTKYKVPEDAECNCPIPTHLHDVGCPLFDPAVGNATVEAVPGVGGDLRAAAEACRLNAKFGAITTSVDSLNRMALLLDSAADALAEKSGNSQGSSKPVCVSCVGEGCHACEGSGFEKS